MIFRLIKLPAVRVNSHLAEQRFHSESASFVGNNRNNPRAKPGVLQKVGQHPNESNRGGHLARLRLPCKGCKSIASRSFHSVGFGNAHWEIPVQLSAAF